MFEECRQRILEEMISGQGRNRAAERGLIRTGLKGLLRVNDAPCRKAMVVLQGGERRIYSRREIDMMLADGKDAALQEILGRAMHGQKVFGFAIGEAGGEKEVRQHVERLRRLAGETGLKVGRRIWSNGTHICFKAKYVHR